MQGPAEKRSPPRFRLPLPREPAASGIRGREVPSKRWGAGRWLPFPSSSHLKASSGATDPAALYRFR